METFRVFVAELTCYSTAHYSIGCQIVAWIATAALLASLYHMLD